jgi:hypothetical protein
MGFYLKPFVGSRAMISERIPRTRPYRIGSPVATFVWLDSPLRVVAALALLASTAFGASTDSSEAREWLRSCLDTQQATDHIAMTIEADFDILQSLQPGGATKARYDLSVRRKKDWLDISGKALPLDAQQDLSEDFRLVTTDQFVRTGHHSARPTPEKVGVVFSKKAKERRLEHLADSEWTFMDGYCPGSGGRRVPELMLESKDIENEGDAEVNGTQCHVVSSSSVQGKFRLWLAPAFGFLPLRAAYEKGPEALFDGEALSARKYPNGSEKPALRMTSWTGEMDEVHVSSLGTTFVPTAAKWTVTYKFNNDSRFLRVTNVKRSNIELNPSFEGTDAFRIDIPEGTRVQNLDDPSSGLQYVWHNGTIEARTVSFEGGVAKFLPPSSSSFWSRHLVVWSLLALAVCLGLIWLLFRARRIRRRL